MFLDIFWLLVGKGKPNGGNGKRRKHFAKQDIYGHVVEAYRKIFETEIAPEVVKEVVETVVVKLEAEVVVVPERDIEAEISVLETKALIMSIMLKMQEEEDEESAFFAMM